MPKKLRWKIVNDAAMLVFGRHARKGLGTRSFYMPLTQSGHKSAGFFDRCSNKNKMASSCDEYFSRLRKLAVTVDKETKELKETLENSEISAYNDNRACLLLRETLAEVKDFKVNQRENTSPMIVLYERLSLNVEDCT